MESAALPFDSTQTVRAVTARELKDPNQQKWFVVQLVVSDRPFNLETMPRLDEFAAYRLYAVRGRLGTDACHALRLGFFSEQQSAQSICDDIRALFRAASVVQVSAAEQARFEKAPDDAPKLSAKQETPARKSSSVGADVVALHVARREVTAGLAKSPASSKKPASGMQGRPKSKSLSQELMEEARQIERAKSGRPGKHGTARNTSWLSRLLGRSNN